MATETFEHTFEVESPACLKVSNVRGSVDIQPGAADVITITAIKQGNNNTQLMIEQESDGRVVVEAKHENGNWFGLHKPCRVDFTIRTPKACSVQVNSVSGSAAINELTGHMEVHSVSGNLQLNNLSGTFNFGSVSGKIAAENLSGALKMNNVSGKVEISGSQIPSIIGKTVSGSVNIETPLTEGPYEFKTVSGNINIITPEDTACTVQMKSVSGKAIVNLPVTSKSGPRHKQVIEAAGGGPEVCAKSVSGILKVGSPNYVQAEIEAASPQAVIEPAVSPAPRKSQMQLLQEIEDGEISVDEALEKMNS